MSTDGNGTKESAPPQATADAVKTLQAALKPGMAYGDFRSLVLAQGWQPVVDPQCKLNTVGDGYEALCAENPQLTNCKVCDELPELSSCGNSAHCLVRFRHPGADQVLEATGYGEVEYWRETGADAGLQVSRWEFVKPAQ